VRDSCKMRQ